MTALGAIPDSSTNTLVNARRLLLAARMAGGHWEGELSSSALSTATATFALWLLTRTSAAGGDLYQRLVRRGAAWLADHENADGGWGDTTDSRSNISTTALCWAALSCIAETDAERGAVERSAGWLTAAAGSLEPATLAEAIAHRYGKDRTFSVPILTFCALAGRLGPADQAWDLVPQLPFELAALPQSWFRFARLPVVSYALPALIAIGQVRHRLRPTRNPVARRVRRLAANRTLHVLEQIQPTGGGFLEATPLTSFVVMSLVAAGQANQPVVSRGVEFLVRSARLDGSWPIDTNLATWVTTLSVNALAADGHLEEHLNADERKVIRDWLLGQQYRCRHPYTGAAPGGWAWTDLPGGVPDADDTAGALLALSRLGERGEVDGKVIDAARAGVRWLMGLQNRDGGIPTFCRGWGKLPFDRSAADLTAHALLAWSAWRDRLGPELAVTVDRAAGRAVRSLRNQQRPDGSWVPLWFGNQAAPEDENPVYGTARVLAALLARPGPTPELRRMTDRGLRYLLAAQNADGGWGGAAGVPSSVEETGQALAALAAEEREGETSAAPLLAASQTRNAELTDESAQPPLVGDAIATAIDRGVRWLATHTDAGRSFSPAPVGLYFAKLWYSERLYPVVACTAAAGGVSKSNQLQTPPPQPDRVLARR